MQPNPLEPFLSRDGVVILDGGLATELERRGADLSDRLWSARLLLDDPALIRDVHLAYFKAGADVATTASYQASIEGFGRKGLGRRAALAAIQSSVALAAEARSIFWDADDRPADRLRPLIAGSVGPFGAALADGSEYRGRYGVSGEVLAEFHRPRLEALVASRVDLLAVETMPSLPEVEVILELLAEWPSVRAWVSFTCSDSEHLSEGQAIQDAARAVTGNRQVVAVGVNCVSPDLIPGLLARLKTSTDLPLVVYPNSGEVWNPVGRCWFGGVSGTDLAESARNWREAGAGLIGGCCRTTPETVFNIRRALSQKL